jgi:hypothetical protein
MKQMRVIRQKINVFLSVEQVQKKCPWFYFIWGAYFNYNPIVL